MTDGAIKIEFDDETPAQEPPVTVRVCRKCGRGFPGWMPSISIDTNPVWWTATSAAPVCGGQIITLNRLSHIENIAKVLLQMRLSNGEGKLL